MRYTVLIHVTTALSINVEATSTEEAEAEALRIARHDWTVGDYGTSEIIDVCEVQDPEDAPLTRNTP